MASLAYIIYIINGRNWFFSQIADLSYNFNFNISRWRIELSVTNFNFFNYKLKHVFVFDYQNSK